MSKTFALIFSFFVFGCVFKNEPIKSITQSVFYKYYESDLSIQNIGLSNNNRDDFVQILALKPIINKQIFSLQKSKDTELVIINLDTGKSIKLSQKRKLKNTKSVKIYEIKTGLVESMSFTSNDGVCISWHAKKHVFANVVSNYYPFLTDDIKIPFATKFELILQKDNGAYVRDFAIINTLFDGEKTAQVQNLQSKDEFKDYIVADIIKQSKILEMICNQK